MLKVAGFIIVGLVAWFFIDIALEYRYWKKEQKQGIAFVKTTLENIKNHSKDESESELNSLRSSFENGSKFTPSHENVEKLAKMYMLTDTLSPRSQDYYEFEQRYLKVGDGLLPGCHYEFLVHLYQIVSGLPQLTPSNFCNGWNQLDKEFEYSGDHPHARSELRY